MIIAASVGLFGQNKEELQKEKKRLQQEIEYTNQLLDETRKTRQNSVAEVQALQQKIRIREQLIATYNREIELFEKDIEEGETRIDSLETELTHLKDAYAESIRKAYTSRSKYQKLMFLLSASDFNQAYRRLQYLKQYNDYRRLQADEIVEKAEQVEREIERVKQQITAKEKSIEEKKAERDALSSEVADKNKTIEQLQGEEKKLKKEIREKEKAAKKLEKAIERIIKEEIERARKEAEKNNAEKPDDGGFALTPEAKALSDNFAANKGKLPWPVEKGYVSGKFGEHPHPVLPGITVRNDGIDITTNKGAEARACFEGVVSGVVVIPGVGEAVIVRHGAYLTVYSNLSEVYVKTGDQVVRKQPLGKINTDIAEGKTVLQFQVWQNTTKQNPEGWIFK
jgi:septal ring factor EnvC (AmiA/AmiB activator)